MWYIGTISPKVSEITRNELIHSFRQWKGEKFVPKTMHSALKWTPSAPFPIQKVTEDTPWTLVKISKDQSSSKADSGTIEEQVEKAPSQKR